MSVTKVYLPGLVDGANQQPGTAYLGVTDNGDGTVSLKTSGPQPLAPSDSPTFAKVFATGAIPNTSLPGDTTLLNYVAWLQEYAATVDDFYDATNPAGTDDSSGGSGAGPGTTAFLVREINTGTSAGNRGSWFQNLKCATCLPGGGVVGQIDWSKPGSLTWRGSFISTLSTDGQLQFTLGNTGGHGTAAAPLGAKGVGVVITNPASVGTVALVTHDGTNMHLSGALFTGLDVSSAGVQHSFMVLWDGQGNAWLYVDGVYAGTVANGPTTISSATNHFFNNDIFTGVSATNNRASIFGCRMVLKKN